MIGTPLGTRIITIALGLRGHEKGAYSTPFPPISSVLFRCVPRIFYSHFPFPISFHIPGDTMSLTVTVFAQ